MLIGSALITLDGECHLQMEHCNVTENSAQSFLFIGLVPNPYQRSTFALRDTVFTKNAKGVYTLNVNGASGVVEDCVFKENNVSSLYLINSNAIVRNSTFSDNISSFPQIVVFISDDGISSANHYYLNVSESNFQQ